MYIENITYTFLCCIRCGYLKITNVFYHMMSYFTICGCRVLRNWSWEPNVDMADRARERESEGDGGTDCHLVVWSPDDQMTTAQCSWFSYDLLSAHQSCWSPDTCVVHSVYPSNNSKHLAVVSSHCLLRWPPSHHLVTIVLSNLNIEWSGVKKVGETGGKVEWCHFQSILLIPSSWKVKK